MTWKSKLRVPFNLLDTSSTIRLGLSSIISLLLCFSTPVVLVMIGYQFDSENLAVIQWLFYTVALCIFISGLFGLLIKQFADALSIGMSLHEEKATKSKIKQNKLTYLDSLKVGFQNIEVIISIVFVSSILLYMGGVVGDVVPQTYECSSGKAIPISHLEDGFDDCIIDLFDEYGNFAGSYAEDEQSGVYWENATPNPVYGMLENLLKFLSATIFIGGMIGLTGKFFADTISVGLTLHGNSSAESTEIIYSEAE